MHWAALPERCFPLSWLLPFGVHVLSAPSLLSSFHVEIYSTFAAYLNCNLCHEPNLSDSWALCTTVYELYLGHASYVPDPWKPEQCLIQNSIPYSFHITSCITWCSDLFAGWMDNTNRYSTYISAAVWLLWRGRLIRVQADSRWSAGPSLSFACLIRSNKGESYMKQDDIKTTLVNIICPQTLSKSYCLTW